MAISFLDNGFSFAISRYQENRRPRLIHCDFVAAPTSQWPQQLETLTKTYQLENYACHILLGPNQYRTFDLDAPQAVGDEIKQAIRWRIADLLDYPVDQAYIDCYPLPESNRAANPAKLTAVCCDRFLLENVLKPCRQAGLRIKVVDIVETALRNIGMLLPENEQGIALLYLQQDAGVLVIQRQGTIYFTRRLNIGFSHLLRSGTEETQAAFDQSNLALEIQRSLDYIENYYGMPPAAGLAIVLMPQQTENLINFLMIHHGINARIMDLSAIVEGDVIFNDPLQNLCAPVIGASLRRFVENKR